MKKLLMTVFFILITFSHIKIFAAKRDITVTFKVTGEGTQHFAPCINDICGDRNSKPAVTRVTYDKKIHYYIGVERVSSTYNPFFDEVVWEPSCSKFPVCTSDQFPKTPSSSDSLCYPYNLPPNKKMTINMTATSTVKNGKLYISNCKI